MKWQPIETAPMDEELKLFWTPLGGAVIAPSVSPTTTSREERVALYQAGAGFPNVGWAPTHWMPLPEPPHVE